MANTLNLDRSQRLDVVCKRGDTFKMNLELKDENNVNIDLNGAYSSSTSDVTSPFYAFKMQVRRSDTDDELTQSTNGSEGFLINKWAEISHRNSANEGYLSITNLATFKVPHSEMDDLESGIYVYDIEKRLYSSIIGIDVDDTTSLESASPSDVETILYGVFTVNEDITL